MPVPVSCPSCRATLSAPDAAAGKRVKCPKCQAPIEVPSADPGYEVVDAPPPVAARPSAITPARVVAARPVRPAPTDDEDDRPVRRPRDEDENDPDDRPPRRRREDDEDDRPIKKPRKKKRSVLPLVIIGGALGLFLLVGGGIAAILVFFGPHDDPPRFPNQQPVGGTTGAPATPTAAGRPSSPPALPTGWRVVSPLGAGVTVHAPVDLPPFNIPAQARKKGVSVKLWQGVHNGKVYQLIVVVHNQPPGGDPEAQLDEMTQGMAEGAKFGQPTSRSAVSVDGRPGRQLVFSQGDKNAVFRATLVGNRAVVVSIVAAQPVDPADPEVAPFLDSVRISK